MKYLISNKKINTSNFSLIEDKVFENKCKNVYFYTNDIPTFENENYLSFIDGYVNDLDLPPENKKEQIRSVLDIVFKEWPVPNHITGSFSICTYNKDSDSLLFCNDCIGVYPLYYYISDDYFIVSSDIFWIASSIKTEIDQVGVVERVLSSDNAFITIGSRTILKNVKRLLPGEKIEIDLRDINNIIKSYDNTLLNISNEYNLSKDSINKYWERYTKEINYLLFNESEGYIALSGGRDSRVVFGGLPKNKNITCLTYGNKKNYEVKVAKKLSAIRKMKFRSFSNLSLYFPPKILFEEYIKKIETLNIPNWVDLLEGIEDKEKYLLLGDLCEALPAHYMKYFSRNKLKKSFFKLFILKSDSILTKTDNKSFDDWKNAKIKETLKAYNYETIKSSLDISITKEALIEGIIADLNDIFDRINAHNLRYVELYDELYAWYTRARKRVGNQVNICRKGFNAVSPPLSIGILRMTSSIHPKYRASESFRNNLFKHIKELKKLNSVPIAQAPLISRNMPYFMVLGIWYLRTTIDQYLIRRIMKKKNPQLRYRVFNDTNWVQVYQQKDVHKIFTSYFENNYLGKIYNLYENKLIKRINLESWPLSNRDLLSIASLNLELELINKINKKKRLS